MVCNGLTSLLLLFLCAASLYAMLVVLALSLYSAIELAHSSLNGTVDARRVAHQLYEAAINIENNLLVVSRRVSRIGAVEASAPRTEWAISISLYWIYLISWFDVCDECLDWCYEIYLIASS